jgi:membrane associated rhomboid family serine protease
MRRAFAALLGVPIGYLVFAFIGYWAIELFSNNTFDRSVEASMTAFFAIGPAGAIVGLVAGLVLGGIWSKSVRLQPSDKDT